MATTSTRSSSLTVLLVTLVAGTRGSPLETLLELPSIGVKSTESPFDAAQYKEYLSNLKCKEMTILHEGVKIPETATGSIYEPTTTSEPLPPLPSPPAAEAVTTKQPIASTSVPTTEATKVTPAPHDIPEYEDDVHKDDKLSDRSNATEESVLLSGAKANGTKECTAPLTREWVDYNWYQVLLDNGGPPGGYLQKGLLKSNLTKALDPCSRPVLQLPPAVTETSFGFTHAEFEKVYRSEQVQVRFPGTPLEFLDVSGKLIWSPPGFKRRYFHFSYRKDDTGLYLKLDRQQTCVFKSDTLVRIECDYIALWCDCVDDREVCVPPPAYGVPAGLQAALVGGGR